MYYLCSVNKKDMKYIILQLGTDNHKYVKEVKVTKSLTSPPSSARLNRKRMRD